MFNLVTRPLSAYVLRRLTDYRSVTWEKLKALVTIHILSCVSICVLKILQYSRTNFSCNPQWPICGGGRYTEVAAIRRWPLFGGGRYTEAAAIRKWPLYGGGRHVVIFSRNLSQHYTNSFPSIRENPVFCPTRILSVLINYLFSIEYINKLVQVFSGTSIIVITFQHWINI